MKNNSVKAKPYRGLSSKNQQGEWKCRKCPVCLKGLQSNNKIGICNKDMHREYSYNYGHQGFRIRNKI